MPLVEAVTNVVGFVIAVAAHMLVFPLFGVHTPLGENLRIRAAYALVSILRSYR